MLKNSLKIILIDQVLQQIDQQQQLLKSLQP